jgi:basic amino acid/polyamine antiporter, APA family
MEPRPSTAGLARVLGLRDLVLITVGTVIGSGIFLVPAVVLRSSGGSAAAAFTVWIIGGVLSILGALTFGELGASRPEAGGLYAYIRDGFGRHMAFVYGWTLFFVIGSGSVATLAVAFASYLREIVDLGPGAAPFVAGAVVAVIGSLNVLGTRESANVQNLSTALKIGAVIAMAVLLLLSSGAAPPSNGSLSAAPSVTLAGVGIAVVAVLWAYEGWQYVTFSAGEARDPQRTFPLGIVVGTSVVVGIYLLANLGYIHVLGAARAAQSERIAAEAVGAVFGPLASKLIAGVVLVSMFSAANALILTSSRVFFAMARDGLFFRSLAGVHPRFGTPAVAVAATSAWSIVLAATGTFEQLLTYAIFSAWIFNALGAASLLVDRRQRPDAVRPFRVPGYPWTPLAFIASAALIVLNTIATQPGRAAVGLLIVATGIPAYWLWRRPGTPPSTSSGGPLS